MTVKSNPDKCISCGGCTSVCPVNAITLKNGEISIDQEKCTECGACIKLCPVKAIKKEEE